MREKARIMDEQAMRRALMRISHEILERNRGAEGVVLVGVKRRGEPIAAMIRDDIEAIEGRRVPCGSIAIDHYRDDRTELADAPLLGPIELDFDVTDRNVILVDDVIYTGRTARAAIDAVLGCGRPRTIQLAALIDRGHRELPIRPDYIGKNIPTSHSETVEVRLPAYDGETGVFIVE